MNHSTARARCPSPIPRVYSNSCLSSQWSHPAISPSIVPFSSGPQSLPASESFPMSQRFTWGGQSTGVSALASFLPKNIEWSRARTNRVLPRKCTDHSKHPLPTTQEKILHMDITRWSTPKSDWLYSCSPRWRSSIQSAKTRRGADYGSDHELLIAKFRLKLKKAGKTARPFKYDLNQIPYDYKWKWEIDLKA